MKNEKSVNVKSAKRATKKKSNPLAKVPFKVWVLLCLVAAIAVGYTVAKQYRINYYEFNSTDGDFKAYFREDPVENYLPFLEDYASSPMMTVTNRHSLGMDEVNRLNGVKSGAAADKLFASMVEKTQGKVLRDDLNDFLIYIPDQNSYVRGRIFFSRNGGTLYRVWSLRETERDLELPSTVKFLYGIELNEPE
jgi:hypothetical protein